MLAQKNVEASPEGAFRVEINSIKSSKRNPNNYFIVHWSARFEREKVNSSFVIKFTDPVLATHNLRPYRNVANNEIIQAREIAEMLISHLVLTQQGRDIHHTVELFFADRTDGSGPFDSRIIWTHKGDFYSA